MSDDRFEDLAEYFAARFPRGNLQTGWPIDSDIYVRYELGEPYANGTDERLAQVNYRATSILEACFRPQDQLLILIDDLQGEAEDPMFCNTTPHYIYELIGGSVLSRAAERMVGRLDTDLTKWAPEYSFRQLLIPACLEEIPYKQILGGIANYEQGREPKIGQQVWFISTERDIAYFMYDDRGCIVFSDSTGKIRHLYEQFSNWLNAYYREPMDVLFRKNG